MEFMIERGSGKMKMIAIKKTAAIFMGICMLVGMLPVKAYAAPSGATAYSINLNQNQNGEIAGLNSPNTAGGNWSGSKVYLGSYQNTPLLWRVLDTGTSNPTNSNQKKLLLQTDNIVTELPFSTTDNSWTDSSVKTFLNNNFLKGFKPVERAQIYAFSKVAGTDTSYNGSSLTNPALSADGVFLLSAEESINPQYGYSSAQRRKLTGASLGSNQWWLRSGKVDDSSMVGIIGADGELGALGITTEQGTEQNAGVAPAVYLDTSKILFTTQGSAKKPTEFSAIETVTDPTSWKLTLSKGGTLEANVNGSVYNRGNDITITHKAAKDLGINATQVSAILTDDNAGKPLFYGKINGNNLDTTSTVKIPDTLEPGNYKLYVFAEEVSAEKVTDYASELGNPMDIDVKATPNITVKPTASGITYNQSLADSSLSGGGATVDNADVPGQFTWKDSSIRPNAADNNKTEYEVIFTPNDTTKYNVTPTTITLGVAKKDVAPNMPQSTIQVEYGVSKVYQIPLPEGWSWRPESVNKDLTAGGETQAIAVYNDTANYLKYDTTITITRYACAHTGGSATCTTQAVCDICKLPYGDVNRNVHGKTEVRNGKDSTCTVKGYTGDTYCVDCNQILILGTEIALKEHNYTSQVTREPTLTVEGIRTFTCTVCKHQYTENMGKHSHYYNGTRTIHWLGCEQQGEIEHYCSCGDAYVDITPALGHAFVAKVTTKATTQKAGIKTFTCSRCSHSYTEVIPKLKGSSSQGGSSSGSGSSTNGGANPISDRIPFVEGNSAISGWNDINKMITKASVGDKLSIRMNDALLIPKKTLETIKGKDVTLSLDIGNSMKWSICGTDITAEKLTDINLKVTKNSSGIPADLVKEVAGELSTMQLSLAHDGEFGGTVQLLIPVDSTKGGYYANLFYYNKETGGLDYIASNQMDGKGIATLSMTHASDYVIVMDTKVFDGSEPKEPETTIPTETVEPETIPVTDLSSEDTGGDGISISVIIIIGLVVLGIGLIFIIVLRARSKKEDY